jgi:hypothetical protein
MGFIFPISGLLMVGIGFCCCTKEEPFSHDVNAAFEEDEVKEVEGEVKESGTKGQDVEMAAIGTVQEQQ